MSYGGWIPKEEEFEKTNFVIEDFAVNLTNKSFESAYI